MLRHFFCGKLPEDNLFFPSIFFFFRSVIFPAWMPVFDSSPFLWSSWQALWVTKLNYFLGWGNFFVWWFQYGPPLQWSLFTQVPIFIWSLKEDSGGPLRLRNLIHSLIIKKKIPCEKIICILFLCIPSTVSNWLPCYWDDFPPHCALFFSDYKADLCLGIAFQNTTPFLLSLPVVHSAYSFLACYFSSPPPT